MDTKLNKYTKKIASHYYFPKLSKKNPPQTNLRGISVEHRRIELLTF